MLAQFPPINCYKMATQFLLNIHTLSVIISRNIIMIKLDMNFPHYHLKSLNFIIKGNFILHHVIQYRYPMILTWEKVLRNLRNVIKIKFSFLSWFFHSVLSMLATFPVTRRERGRRGNLGGSVGGRWRCCIVWCSLQIEYIILTRLQTQPEKHTQFTH